MSEQWRPVKDFEGYYEVSDLGAVRSLHRDEPRLLRAAVRGNGYPMLTLYAAGRHRTFCLHRLVAVAFLPKPEPGMEVCHVDGDRLNPRADNLRWGTRSDNLRDSVRHGTHVHAIKTHCPRGHAYDEANTYHYRGRRNCRQCRRDNYQTKAA